MRAEIQSIEDQARTSRIGHRDLANSESASGERNILLVNDVREFRKPLGEKVAKIEKFEFLGGFLRASGLAKIIELAPDRCLLEILGVSQKRKVGFAEKCRQHSQSQQ